MGEEVDKSTKSKLNFGHLARFSDNINEHFWFRWYPTFFSSNKTHMGGFSVFSAQKPKGGPLEEKKYFSNEFSDLDKIRLKIFKVKTCIILFLGPWNLVHALCILCLASLVF